MLDVLPFACMIVMGRRDDDRGASMQRRSFITGLLALAAGGTGTLAAFEAAAAPATQSIVPLLPNAAAEDAAMAAPDGTPIETAQNRNSVHWHHRNRRHRHHRRHVRRRRVCRIHFDRWGRRVQRCHWVWG